MHPYWSVLSSPFLVLLGAPLAIVPRRGRVVLLSLYWALLLAGGLLLGISYLPSVQPDPSTCCHPSRGLTKFLGPCHDLTRLGHLHPGVRASRCAKRNFTETLLLLSALGCWAAALLLTVVGGSIRLAVLARGSRRELKETADAKVRSDLIRELLHRTEVWHYRDLYCFGLALMAYTFLGYALAAAAQAAILAGFLLWWYFVSPSTHVVAELRHHLMAAFFLGLMFIITHQVVIPIVHYWHCCPGGWAWNCPHRRSPCDAGFRGLRDWPESLWIAYGIVALLSSSLIFLAWARLRHARAHWQKALEQQYASPP